MVGPIFRGRVRLQHRWLEPSMQLDSGQLPDSTRLRALDPVILVVYWGAIIRGPVVSEVPSQIACAPEKADVFVPHIMFVVDFLHPPSRREGRNRDRDSPIVIRRSTEYVAKLIRPPWFEPTYGVS